MLDPFGIAASRTKKPARGTPHPVHPGWPESTAEVRTTSGLRVRLRPLRRGDGADWCEQRLVDQSWLQPVEPTAMRGWEAAHTKTAWLEHLRWLNVQARHGELVPFVIEVDDEFAGQLTLGGIQHGTVASCWVGYWVASLMMGNSVATAALALGIDHAFQRIGVHRITATYLPDNPASRQVLMNNGFSEEGILRGYLHIAGSWRDHQQASLLADDYSTSATARLRASGKLL
ncbi:GNAT family protein [Corynebacterium pseudodiphtheriticum]|uniref:GNAT family N-acetyltransferase n=1 Tax=Corynebacterium pseudodiphtheriticum TaxID=37637 RepID=UPI00253F7807|nr:GNAT family protein [Corynebacterium pseudodiphtheriticum]MDK4249788.1 GNAT family protein [Corynebacterium pseudodiphtheriticum]MDK4288011.1 GNAT family protein [Corynebacterium pseudodiphtheriticum]MDK4339067.1 GNAT family protein [Corynebacterium pseudodiphtheriticum]